MATFLKDPNATLDYTIDWSAWLGTDNIMASNWTVPTGLTLMRADSTPTQAIAWLSGGQLGKSYSVLNAITTAAGRQDRRSIMVVIAAR